MMMLSALSSPSGSEYMSPWRRLEAIPAASSFTRARRSISDERPIDRPLNLALGDMQRADLIPHLGVAGEIAVRRLGSFGANRLRASRVRREQSASRCVRPTVDQREHRLN